VLGEWAAARCEGSKAPGATNLGGPGALRDPRLHVVRPALRYLACSAHGATLLREEISDEFAVVVPAAGNARSSEEREVLKHRAQSVAPTDAEELQRKAPHLSIGPSCPSSVY
jgi:hypothetical protein